MRQIDCPECGAPMWEGGTCPWASSRGCGRRLDVQPKATVQNSTPVNRVRPPLLRPVRVLDRAPRPPKPPRPKAIAACHPERKHYSKGQCRPCYDNAGRPERTVMCRCGQTFVTRHKTQAYCSRKCAVSSWNAESWRRRKASRPRLRRIGKAPASCHPDRVMAAHGLCRPCYQRDWYKRRAATAA